MPLELKAPSGLWLLGMLLPLVLLYVLKIRRQRVTVSSTWLWAAAARDLAAKSPFKRLVAQVPLLLELLALCLLALALARPASRGGHIAGDHVAIVLDTSASMATVEPDGRSRLAHAKDAASSVIAALAPGAQAVLVEAGREAHVVSPMDSDRRRLEASLAKLEASDAEGRMTQAIATASSQLRPFERSARLVVVSDGALADRDAFAASNLPLELVRVGSPVDNTAIVRPRYRQRRGQDDPTASKCRRSPWSRTTARSHAACTSRSACGTSCSRWPHAASTLGPGRTHSGRARIRTRSRRSGRRLESSNFRHMTPYSATTARTAACRVAPSCKW
ncbi:MAG: VWA domain-containing protein, partial [Pseudomonadota bacterium]